MMKKFCAAIVAAAMIQATASAAVVFTEDFSYADGDLAGNGAWKAHSGSVPVTVSGGAAIVNNDSGSQDVNRFFDEISSGFASYQFDMVVNADAPVAGGDYEYFAHFGNSGNNGDGVNTQSFVARLDVVEASDGTGDYSLGIASFGSTADAVTTQSFAFGDTVSVLVDFNVDSDTATLSVGGESITGRIGTQSTAVNTFVLRQSGSSSDETIAIDNLIISQVSAIPEPSSLASLGLLACGTVMAVRRRRK
ncbi:PEP-CTERM sorting domain-containing protein [Roseiconus lacunae]|uniref:PEP-CTERM sorting domain-containing protein n=1 Tax=Roseiconus lacunae TaxID=2605694 RepID=UPI0030930FD8|nr:PEP-CTERM sorting domain-containing protein [Stieleria sp. HD01]